MFTYGLNSPPTSATGENILTGVYSSTSSLEACKQEIIHDLDPTAPSVNDFLAEIHSASSFPELARLLDEANFIEINDSGHGMSAEDLNEIYLTIGTHHRKKQLEERRLSTQTTGRSTHVCSPDTRRKRPWPIVGDATWVAA